MKIFKPIIRGLKITERIFYVSFIVVCILVLVLGLAIFTSTKQVKAATIVTLSYTGSVQSWTAPSGVTSITISARGAGGGSNVYFPGTYGGVGGSATGTLTVTPGTTYYYSIGGGGGIANVGTSGGGAAGYGGGGTGGYQNCCSNDYGGGGGGGMTWFGTASTFSQGTAIIVAGGGGGDAGGWYYDTMTYGGNGGGSSGQNGVSSGAVGGGGGGTQSAGGTAGTGDSSNPGTVGVAGVGGNGGNGTYYGGGGGGGGYYGGGGAGGGTTNNGVGSGGGGSGYISSALTNAVDSQAGGAVGQANGSLTITYTSNLAFQKDTNGTLTTNLTSYYNMQGNSNDIWGSNNGTDTSVSYGTSYGKIGQGALCNGNSSKIVTGDSGFSASAGSISVWINASSITSGAGLFDTYPAGQGALRLYWGSATTIDYETGGSSGHSVSYTISPGTWYNLVLTWTGSVTDLYINGVGQGNYSNSYAPAITTFVMCGFNNGNYFNGDEDEVGIWSKVLSTQEISDLYNGGAGDTLVAPNPIPTTTSINPASATAGGTGFNITVNGTNFVSNSVVDFNGSALTTTYSSATQLTAAIPTGDLTTAGTDPITVFNPTPGGGTSNSQTFSLNSSGGSGSWLGGWNYRQQINFNGQSGAGTNYQVKLLIGESSGSTGAQFNLNGHSASFPSGKNAGGDLQFTAADGQTTLPFWVETVTGTAPNRVATVWVNVSANLSTNQFIELYYGNSSATNASNGANTFIVFDDFNDSSPSSTIWFDQTYTNGGVATSNDGGIVESGGDLTVTNVTTDYGHVIAANTFLPASGFAVETSMIDGNGTGSGSSYAWIYMDLNVSTSTIRSESGPWLEINLDDLDAYSGDGVQYSDSGQNYLSYYYTGGTRSIAAVSTAGNWWGSWKRVSWDVVPATGYMQYTRTLESTGASVTISGTSTYTTQTSQRFYLSPWNYGWWTGQYAEFDWVAIRKYQPNEPSFSSSGGEQTQPTNPVPTETSISPNSTTTNSSGFNLTVSGTNFISTSVADWNGVALSTTYNSATQLTAVIPTGDLTTAGSFPITVFNPTPGGGTSNSQTFTVTSNPIPTTSSISPTSTIAGGSGFNLTVSGTNFISTSVADWNGVALSTTYNSATQLTAVIPTGDLTTAGSFPITVFNPTPGGGTSNSQTFTVGGGNNGNGQFRGPSSGPASSLGVTILPIIYGGTGATTVTLAKSALGIASAGANSDITSLSAITTPLAVSEGGTGLSSTGPSGDVLISNGTSWVASGLSSSGNIVTSGGAPTAPVYNGTANFSYSGGVVSWTVPSGVSSIGITAYGAAGGGVAGGGAGGFAGATLSVTPGTTYYISVGGLGGASQLGSNTGSTYSGGGGGGMTWFSPDSSYDTNVMVVAAGGGGGGGYDLNTSSGASSGGAGGYGGGGAGGSSSGSSPGCGGGGGGYYGGVGAGGGGGGAGGTQSSGYASGQGGAGASSCMDGNEFNVYYTGQGGAGGGLTGNTGGSAGPSASGGGGGSSYIRSIASLTSPSTSSGAEGGNGYLSISYSQASPWSVVGTDSDGVVTVSSGAITTVTLDFAQPFNNPPSCSAISYNGTSTYVPSVTTSAVSFGFSSSIGGSQFNYICLGH